MVPNVCPGTEYKWGRTFLSEGGLFTFRDRREEGQMSAERSEARQSFWTEIKEREKFSRGKKSVRVCTFRPQVHTIGIIGGYIFFLIWSLFNHRSLLNVIYGRPLLGRHLWIPPTLLEHYRSRDHIHTYFIIQNFCGAKILNYKISMYVYDRATYNAWIRH